MSSLNVDDIKVDDMNLLSEFLDLHCSAAGTHSILLGDVLIPQSSLQTSWIFSRRSKTNLRSCCLWPFCFFKLGLRLLQPHQACPLMNEGSIAAVLTHGLLFPIGTFSNVWRHFWLLQLERNPLVGKGQECCQWTGLPPTSNNLTAQSAISIKVEKSWHVVDILI